MAAVWPRCERYSRDRCNQCYLIQCQHQSAMDGRRGLAAKLHQWKLQADAITDDATNSACEKVLQWIAAGTLLRVMQQWLMQADVITYNATICAWEGPQWVSAVALRREMQQ